MSNPPQSFPSAELDWLGRFRSHSLEQAYLLEKWPRHAARMRWVCLITALADMLAIGLDMARFDGWQLALMLAGRGTAVAVGLATFRLTFRPARPFLFDAVLAAYMLLVGVHECVEIWLLQPEHLVNAQLTVIIVLFFYLFLPPNLFTSLAGGLGSSVLYIVTLVLGTSVGVMDVYTQLLFFGLANGFGIYFLTAYHRFQRREFKVLRDMREVNEALSRQVEATNEANVRLKELAATDGLTGAFNRRRFFEVLETEFQRARRYGHPLSVVMFDLDHFKKVNDSFGHAAGDEALRHVARLFTSQQRGTDAFGRLGGEEFALILPETNLEQARTVAERICAALAANQVEVPGGRVRLTLSAGAAVITDADPDAEALLRRADERLYGAKKMGRNRLC